MSNIGVRTPPQSRRKPKHLSCLRPNKRSDSNLFEIGPHMKPFCVTNDNNNNNNTNGHNLQPIPSTRQGSLTTLDDASSIVEQVSTPSKVDSPHSGRSRSSTKGSQNDLTNLTINDSSVSKSLATLTITPRESIYVRTLFRYDPATDRGLPAKGLPFEHGDILYVVNANDPEWWQARYRFPIDPPSWSKKNSGNSTNTVANSNSSSNNNSKNDSALPPTPNQTAQRRLGIIPSQRRTERRNQMLAKRVKFIDRNVTIGNQQQQWSAAAAFSTTPSPGFHGTENSICSSSAGGAATSRRFFGNGATDSLKDEDLTTTISKNSGSSTSLINSANIEGSSSFANGDSMSVGGTLDRKKKPSAFAIFKRFSSRRGRKDLDLELIKKKSVSLENVQDTSIRLSKTYEIVQPITLKMARPLVLFSPLKARIVEELLNAPDGGFASCIQHTSRPPMPGEMDGVDFHFVDSKASMQADIAAGKFIDVVIQSDNFYAISLQSVIDVLQQGKICILDVTVKTVFRLQTAGLYPISVLIKPVTALQWRSLQQRLTIDQARRMYEACLQIEAEYWYMLTAILNLESLSTAIVDIQRVLTQHRGPKVWVPMSAQPLNSSIPISGSISPNQPRR